MPLGNYERKQRQLREERTQDYQLFLQQQQQQQQQPRVDALVVLVTYVSIICGIPGVLQSEGRHYAKDNHKTSGTTLMLTDRTAEKVSQIILLHVCAYRRDLTYGTCGIARVTWAWFR